MRINHNLASLNIYRQLSSNSAYGAKSLEKLSSGFRTNKSGDDAAGLAIAEKMRGQIRGLDQVSRNAQDVISKTQAADNGLHDIGGKIQRMRELAIKATNGAITSDDRKTIQDQYKGLAQQIDEIGNSAAYYSQKLLNGKGSIDVGKDASKGSQISNLVKANDDGTTYSLAIGDFRSEALGISGLDFSTQEAATAALEKIDSAGEKVSGQSEDFGKVEKYFEGQISHLWSASDNLANAENRIKDFDMAKEMLAFTQTNILNQAAQAMLAQANQQPQGVLQLLR